jgi:proteic killer suppression protein
MAIVSFRCKETAAFFTTGKSKRFASIATAAARKLSMLDAAQTLDFLRSPPGNKLHPLKDDRAGQHAISINDQYRICFVWTEGNATNVEIVDYH